MEVFLCLSLITFPMTSLYRLLNIEFLMTAFRYCYLYARVLLLMALFTEFLCLLLNIWLGAYRLALLIVLIGLDCYCPKELALLLGDKKLLGEKAFASSSPFTIWLLAIWRKEDLFEFELSLLLEGPGKNWRTF